MAMRDLWKRNAERLGAAALMLAAFGGMALINAWLGREEKKAGAASFDPWTERYDPERGE